ncbi:hypothetical protein KDK88_09840 [bacterium]|nr:hypothetical protein [bacterium]
MDKNFRIVIAAAFCALLAGCAPPKTLSVQWTRLDDAIVRVIHPVSAEIIGEDTIPCFMTLSRPGARPFFLELELADGEKIYGEMQILNVTETASFTGAPVAITAEAVQSVRDQKLYEVTVHDPGTGQRVLVVKLGPVMPPRMRDLYERKGMLY